MKAKQSKKDRAAENQRKLYNLERKFNRHEERKMAAEGKAREAEGKAETLKVALTESEKKGAEALRTVEELEGELEQASKKIDTLERNKNALRMQATRAPAKQARAVNAAVEKTVLQEHSVNCVIHLKEKGVIPDNVRAMVRDLVSGGISAQQLPQAIHTFAAHNNMSVEGSIDKRSVGRIMLEGGIASRIQVAEMMSQTKGDIPATIQLIMLR